MRSSYRTLSASCGLGLVMLLFPPSVSGQAAPLTPGQRVRVTVPPTRDDSTTSIYGTFVRLDDNRVVIVPTGRAHAETLTITLDEAQGRRLEIPGRKHGHAGRGAIIGAFIGAFTGVIVGAVTNPPGGDFIVATPQDAKEALVIVGTVSGALLGGIVGTLDRTQEWLPVRAGTGDVQVALTYHGVGFRVGF